MQHIETQDFSTTVAQELHTLAQASDLIEVEVVAGAPCAGAQLATELAIGESTFRTRWLPWLQKVAPVELLKTDEGYTGLVRWRSRPCGVSLALEFKQVPSKKAHRDRWVSEAKQRYSREFLPGGITPEGVPDELGGALALLRDQGGCDFRARRKSVGF